MTFKTSSCSRLVVASLLLPGLSGQTTNYPTSMVLYDPLQGGANAYANNGNGTLAVPSYIFVNPGFTTIPVGDFNGDTRSDLIFYNSATTVPPDYIGLGQGNGSFAFQGLFWSQNYNFVRAGDLNGDKKTDFVLYT